LPVVIIVFVLHTFCLESKVFLLAFFAKICTYGVAFLYLSVQMKILSNFDTSLSKQLYDEACEKNGKENVVFIRRDKIYRVLRVYMPIITWTISTIILLSLYYSMRNNGSGIGLLLGVLIWTIIIGWGIYRWYRVTYRLMDYYMDYAIITPSQITVYDQDGLFKRDTRLLDTSKIKTINIASDGLLCSIFNFGSIVFLAEGDRDYGDIKLNYISSPVHLRDRILKLMELDENIHEN